MKLPNKLRSEIVEALNASAKVLLQQDIKVRTGVGVVRISLDPSVVISAMAYTREAYMDRVKEKLSGGCREHFKAEYAQREMRLRREKKAKVPRELSQQKWVEHWQMEARSLLEEQLPDVLLHDVKFSSAGRKKAALQALDSFMPTSALSRMKSALSIVKRDYRLKETLCSVTRSDAESFKAIVSGIIDKTFQEGAEDSE